MNLPIKGIIPPIVTPLLENGDLDSRGLRNIIGHMLEGGVHGLFLLGTTGEGSSLSHVLRKQLVTEACDFINSRVPVLVCITDTSCKESLELAEHSKQMGVDALVVAPPYYLPISQGEMQQYLEYLAPLLPLPFLLYNMPSCTKLQLSLETIKKGKELGAIGIKDSSGDWDYLHSLIEEFGGDPTFSIVTGTELFLPQLIAKGGHGAVAGGANFFPRLFVTLYEACLAKDTETISQLLKKVKLIGTTIYNVGKQESKYIKGTKCVLSVLGLCHDQVAPPLSRFTMSERRLIQNHLSNFPLDDQYLTGL
ncbi:dihydrodipicolinate synthase family protein [Ulvibacterium sp.]|uniref:dihydrodipicolinate synthase family protein n=1 Tax=Ulvibacterium sp. TaxID=2665914 RepID=UPI003CC66BC7